MVKGLIGGAIAAAIGAAAWAFLAIVINIEFGLLAWVIGGMVGFGVAFGERPGIESAAIAVALSVLAIVGGKYASASHTVDEVLGDIAILNPADLEQSIREEYQDESQILWQLTDNLALEREEAGETLEWPPGMDYESAFELEDYPADVRSSAQIEFNAMTPDDRAAWIDEQVKTAIDMIGSGAESELASEIKWMAFKDMWGVMDILFLGLAVVTAGGMGMKGVEGIS